MGARYFILLIRIPGIRIAGIGCTKLCVGRPCKVHIGVESDGLLEVAWAADEKACRRRDLTSGFHSLRHSELLTRIVASDLEVDGLKPWPCLLTSLRGFHCEELRGHGTA